MEAPSDHLESPKASELDKETIQHLLASYGIVDALNDDTSTSPVHIDSVWQQVEIDL